MNIVILKHSLYLGGMCIFGSLVSLMPIVPKLLGTNAVSNYTTKPIGLPYHVKYYIDLEKYYYPVLIHSYLASAARLIIIIAFDTCLVILVRHCCGLFSAVRYTFDDLNLPTYEMPETSEHFYFVHQVPVGAHTKIHRTG